MKILNLAFFLLLTVFGVGDLWAISAGFNIQGRLTDVNGVNKEGSFQMKFSIYSSAGPEGTLVWEKTMLAGQDNKLVTVKNGNFQVVLQGPGDNAVQLETAVKDLDAAYVEIKVADEPPLAPRQQLLRSPFSPPAVNMVGAVMFFAGSGCPAGWLLANGANLPNTGTYGVLFSYLQYTYGKVGDNFVLPNMLDGSFMRGTGGNAAVLGVKQTDSFQGHTHDYSFPAAPWTGVGNGFYMGKSNGNASWTSITSNYTIQSVPEYGAVRVATETRPVAFSEPIRPGF